MITNTMSNIVARYPRVSSFFYFFFVYSFFLLKGERERPVYFHWNYNLDKSNTLRFHSNNSISTKFKKEETTYNLHPYINLSRGASF